MVPSNVRGEHIDARKYWAPLRKNYTLAIPVICASNHSSKCRHVHTLSHVGGAFGFGVDTSFCAVRMIVSGVFEEYHDLKVILGDDSVLLEKN